MKKEQKTEVINALAQSLGEYTHYYLTDISGLNAEKTTKLRRRCFEKDVKLVVVKNTFFAKALEGAGKANSELETLLTGSSAIMFSNIGNAPAKLITEFRKEAADERPILKGAYVQECSYVGNDQLVALVNLKSKDELIADVIALLQSPAKTVISALQSNAGQKIAGLVKTLAERSA